MWFWCRILGFVVLVSGNLLDEATNIEKEANVRKCYLQ
jgi:hypothetical protein